MRGVMQKYKRKLIVWLLKQLGIEEDHIGVVVGELTMYEARQRAMSRHIGMLREIEHTPLPRRDVIRVNGGGYVYFIASRKQRIVKIGYSANPTMRLSTLQTSTPSKLELLATIEGDIQTERQLHQRFAAYRLNGEWFRLTEELTSFIDSLYETSPTTG